jgi:mRNA interferase HigB
MRVINREVVQDFSKLHPDAEKPLNAWLDEADRASWNTPMDIKNLFGTASILGGKRVVFNIGGNKYRLVVEVRYGTQETEGVVLIRWVGTHKEYDEINAEAI